MIIADQITIGVELEMLVCDSLQSTEWLYLPINEEYRLVAQALKPLATGLGIRVIDTGSNHMTQYNDTCLTAAFHVQSDGSINRDSEVQRGIEVATPILRYGQWKSVIPHMCQALRENFSLGFNHSTGLHVHVGIGQPYTLQDLKRISKAIILFETQMDKYHPGCRSSILDPWDYNYIQSNRHNRVFEGLTNLECIRVIDEASSINRLLSKINSHETANDLHITSYKYNLTSLIRFNTIEFRQAIATDNEDRIIDWISRVILFVTSAISTPDEVFETWAKNGINNLEIYKDFGVPTSEG